MRILAFPDAIDGGRIEVDTHGLGDDMPEKKTYKKEAIEAVQQFGDQLLLAINMDRTLRLQNSDGKNRPMIGIQAVMAGAEEIGRQLSLLSKDI